MFDFIADHSYLISAFTLIIILIVLFILTELTSDNDPVRHCDVYKDKENGSCSHVDGFLCDYPKCSILQDYRTKKGKTNGSII